MVRLSKIALLVLSITVVCCLPRAISATTTENNQRFEFIVDFADPDWNHMTINATISSTFSELPSSLFSISCTVTNSHYFGDEPWYGGWVKYDVVPSETKTVNETTLVTFVNETTARFWLIGISEFYPYDSYLLNLTFTFADDGLANENNTSVEMNFPWWRFFGWEIETTTAIKREIDFAKIVSTATLSRSSWSLTPYRFILLIMFAVLGVSFLINPKDLQSRLTIYIAVLLFSITFFFQITSTAPPRGGSLCLLESLILGLLLGASAFLLLSVTEKVGICDYKILPEVRGTFLIETIAVIFVAFYMLGNFNAYVTAAEVHFPWVEIPYLGFELVFALSCGILAKYMYYVGQYIGKGIERLGSWLKNLRIRSRQ